MQLFFIVEQWNEERNEREKSPDAHHVRSLWGMSREKRLLLWRELQSTLRLEELGLGGEWFGTRCRVEDEEISILCPEGCLRHLKIFFLYAADNLTDDGFRALAEAGCGANLTSLSLSSG